MPEIYQHICRTTNERAPKSFVGQIYVSRLVRKAGKIFPRVYVIYITRAALTTFACASLLLKSLISYICLHLNWNISPDVTMIVPFMPGPSGSRLLKSAAEVQPATDILRISYIVYTALISHAHNPVRHHLGHVIYAVRHPCRLSVCHIYCAGRYRCVYINLYHSPSFIRPQRVASS